MQRQVNNCPKTRVIYFRKSYFWFDLEPVFQLDNSQASVCSNLCSFMHSGQLVQQRKSSDSHCAPGSVDSQKALLNYPEQVSRQQKHSLIKSLWAHFTWQRWLWVGSWEDFYNFFPVKIFKEVIQIKQTHYQTHLRRPIGALSWSKIGLCSCPFNTVLRIYYVP